MGSILNERGEIVLSFTDKNGNSQDDRWLYQVQLAESENVQIVEKNQLSGFASRPPAGSKVIVSKINGAYLISVAEYDGILNSDLAEGETRAYSISGGAISAFIKFLVNGNLELNGNSDFAVSWTDLNAQLQTLISDINTALATKKDEAGSAGTLALDLSSAKVTNVLLP